jgi:peptide/nickel transport system permease protein
MIVIFLFGSAIFADYVTPMSPYKQDLSHSLSPPGLRHLLGTDNLGRDIFTRIIYGTRIVVYIFFLTAIIGSGLGISLGLISGYFGGAIDNAIMRVADVILAFPSILLALALVSAVGPGLDNAVIAIGISQVASYIRLVRGQTLSAKQLVYIEAERALGASTTRIIFRRILPNISGSIIVQATFNLGSAIVMVAALGFLGLGARPPTPDWGTMLFDGRSYMRIAPWTVLFPGLAIFLVSLALNTLGEVIRDSLDPRLRSQILGRY